MRVIEKVDAPTKWCSLIITDFPKSNGKVQIPRNGGESIQESRAHPPAQGTSQQEECLHLGSSLTAHIQCSQREILLSSTSTLLLLLQSCPLDKLVC